MAYLAEIDPEALARIEAKLDRIEAALEGKTAWKSIQEAAAREGVSESTIRRRINAGELDVKGHGKLLRVRL
ncbi:MAG: DNA-binding protein [Pseudomonadota bacterium]